MICGINTGAQHDLRNGVIELSRALYNLFRSPIFGEYATQVELKYLSDAMNSCERVRNALEPCQHRHDCELINTIPPPANGIGGQGGDGE